MRRADEVKDRYLLLPSPLSASLSSPLTPLTFFSLPYFAGFRLIILSLVNNVAFAPTPPQVKSCAQKAIESLKEKFKIWEYANFFFSLLYISSSQLLTAPSPFLCFLPLLISFPPFTSLPPPPLPSPSPPPSLLLPSLPPLRPSPPLPLSL